MISKADLREVLLETLGDLAIPQVWSEHVRRGGGVLRIGEEVLQLAEFGRVVVFALGKAAGPMAAAMGDSLRDAGREFEGLAVGPGLQGVDGFRLLDGSHPVADACSLAAANAVRELLTPLGDEDLVLFLMSGGGSAMLEEPVTSELSLGDVAAVGAVLATGFWPILEMNATRSALSAVKGGRLAALAAPAKQVTLVVSDVPVGAPEAVSSGPTLPRGDASPLFEDPMFRSLVPPAVLDWWDAGGVRGLDDGCFARSSHHVMLDSDNAVAALEKRLVLRGLEVERCCLPEGSSVAQTATGMLDLARPGVAVICGGECVSPVVGDGVGGRNQAFMLELVPRLAGTSMVAASLGTDGIDGNSPAAGAVADGESLARLDVAGYEERSDSYGYFEALGDAIVTGGTGQNLRDLRVVVMNPRRCPLR